MAKLSSQLMVRLDEAAARELNDFCERTHLSATDIARGLLRSFLDRVAERREITFPLAVVPASYLAQLEGDSTVLAAEPEPGAGHPVQADPTAIAHAAHPDSVRYPKAKSPKKAKGSSAPK